MPLNPEHTAPLRIVLPEYFCFSSLDWMKLTKKSITTFLIEYIDILLMDISGNVHSRDCRYNDVQTWHSFWFLDSLYTYVETCVEKKEKCNISLLRVKRVTSDLDFCIFRFCTFASMRSLRSSTISGSLVNSSNRYCHSQVSWPNVPLVTKNMPLAKTTQNV